MNEYPLEERKLIYRILHRNLKQFPELLDGTFLDDLQSGLQKVARADGVDATDHEAWDAWLGNEPSTCTLRRG